jgi:hypothetical protein
MNDVVFVALYIFLRRMPRPDHSLDIVPFLAANLLFVLAFTGLASSFYPYAAGKAGNLGSRSLAREPAHHLCWGVRRASGHCRLFCRRHRVFRDKASALRYD